MESKTYKFYTLSDSASIEEKKKRTEQKQYRTVDSTPQKLRQTNPLRIWMDRICIMFLTQINCPFQESGAKRDQIKFRVLFKNGETIHNGIGFWIR